MKEVSIVDTTLRDGEQAPGNAMSPHDKLALGLEIEKLGVQYIEGGFPASSPADQEATRLLSKRLSTSGLMSFCRAIASDVAMALEAGGTSSRHRIQILATGSEIHLKHKRGLTPAEGILEVVETVRLTRSLGSNPISVGIEDASRGSYDYLRALIEQSVSAGASNIVIADTTGCATPKEFGALVARARQWAPPAVTIATHCHDDLGLALANTLAGIEAGAQEAQVTLGGIGERAGNTALEELGALLHYKAEQYQACTSLRLDNMYTAYSRLRKIIGLEESRNKSIFGRYAFATAAGIHQQGMLRDPSTYEYVEPQKFGRERAMLIARHSGRAVLRHLLERMGQCTDEQTVNELYQKHVLARTTGDSEDIAILQERLRAELPSAVMNLEDAQ